MESFTCDICKITLKNEVTLQKHYKSYRHKRRINNQNNTNTCVLCVCGKEYSCRQSLYMHRKQCETYKNKLNNIPETNTEPDLPNQTTVVVEKQEIDHLHNMIFCLQTQLQTQNQTQTKILSQIQTQLQTQLPSNKVDAQTQTSASIIPKQDRKKISKKVREEIVNSQNNTCNQCERSLSKYFQIDHRVALQYGGTDDVDNLQALCSECHCKKSIIENAVRHKIQDSIGDIIDTEFRKIEEHA